MKDDALVLGAVAYDPKVVTILDGFQRYFAGRGFAFDYVLFTNYESQVAAQFDGRIDVAWNSPLAWLEAERAAARCGRRAEAICMRDTDRDLSSIVVVRDSERVHAIEDLRGKKVAVGAKDSPQATLIPLNFLAEKGLSAGRDFQVLPYDVLVGKHGDHIGGERDAVKALMRGECDAACILDANHLLFRTEGTLPPSGTHVLARTGSFDHCNFTVLDGAPQERIARFREMLLAMEYGDGEVRPLMDLEALKKWEPGRTSGYAQLTAAIDRFGTIDDFIKVLCPG